MIGTCYDTHTQSIPGFLGLDASRTWLCYWILHGLALLERPLPVEPGRASIIAFLSSCQDPEGGFGGGPYQLPHLAPTYAGRSRVAAEMARAAQQQNGQSSGDGVCVLPVLSTPLTPVLCMLPAQPSPPW